MESLKIRDKKQHAELQETVQEPVETKAETTTPVAETIQENVQQAETVQPEHNVSEQQSKKAAKLTFGQSLMEKVKKFFEEVE